MKFPNKILLDGVHGYAQRSVAPGETLNICVSSDVHYQIAIWKLGRDPESHDEDKLIELLPGKEGCRQPIFPGSYVHHTVGLPEAQPLTEFSAECWVRPWGGVNRPQGLISQYSFGACGFALILGGQQIQGYIGDGKEFNFDWFGWSTLSPQITFQKWHHVALTWRKGSRFNLYLDGNLAPLCDHYANNGSFYRGPLIPGHSPLRLGAYGDKGGLNGRTLNGDIAMPALYNRALTASEIKQRFEEVGIGTANYKPPQSREGVNGLLAWWPLREETGTSVTSRGPRSLTGEVINCGTWMIGGPGFELKFKDLYSQRQNDGHGLRLAPDDLYDFGWKPTDHFVVSPDARSGVYVARIKSLAPDEYIYDIPFIVRAPKRLQPTEGLPRILVLCAVNTWMAYGRSFDSNDKSQEPSAKFLSI